MENEPVSADLDAVDGFVTQGDAGVPVLAAMVGELRDRRDRLGRLGLPYFVDWSALDRFEELLAVLVENGRFVADVADTLRGLGWPTSSGWYETASSVVSRVLAATEDERLDELERALITGGMTPPEAAVLRAEVAKRLTADHTLRFGDAVLDGAAAYQGVTRAELEQAGRAFRLTRAETARILAHNFDLVAGRTGRSDQITVEDLIAAAEASDGPRLVRDAAYRLAADANLFTAVDVARQTDLTTVPFRGFHRNHSDGIVSRDDLDAFPRVEFEHNILAAWLPLIDTADQGYDHTRADSRIGESAITAFIADGEVPLHVRAAVYDVYRHSHTLVDPRTLRPPPSDEPGTGMGEGAWAVAARTVPRIVTAASVETVAIGTAQAVAGYAVLLVVAGVIGWRIGRAERQVREGDPAVRHVNPTTGEITTFDLDQLDDLTPTQRKNWVAHLSAHGEPPPDPATAGGPYPWLHPTGQWRWSDTGSPIHHLDPTTASGSGHDATPLVPDPPGTYRDGAGKLRYLHDSKPFDGYLLSPTERQDYYRPPGRLADDTTPQFVIDGITYQRHQVTFHPLCDDNGTHVRLHGQPLYRVEPLGSSGFKINGSKSLVKQKDTGWWHLDLENPPSHVGQLHLQFSDKGKQQRFIYDFNTDTFLPSASGATLTKRQLAEITSHPDYNDALIEARRRLNVDVVGGECE